MNFLAHLYLSGNNPKIMVGNFIGDFVKGKSAAAGFEDDIAFGIDLHRNIDEFTDRHTIVKDSKVRLREKYRHYSGVIVDMFYDHFLSKNWSAFHTQTLSDYSSFAFQVLQDHSAILPERVNRLLPYMIQGNWLVGYGTVYGIGRALSGMSQRTPFKSRMDEASNDLQEHYPMFEDEFMRFFPELKAFAEGLIRKRDT